MSFIVEDGEALCSIEERGARLSEQMRSLKAAIEFALLADATDVLHANTALVLSRQLDQVLAEYEAYQTELRGFIGRYRLRAKWVSF